MYKQSFKLFLCLIISSMCLLTDVYARDKNTLVIGKVSADLDARDRQAAKLLADSLLPDLKEEGIEKTEVLLTENITDMLHALKSGEVDWVSDNLFVALVLAEKTRSQVFYSNTREINKINTVFFVRKNSVLNSINNLEKRIVLFSDPLSSNGYFVPFYELTSHGYTPKVYGSEEAAISGEKKRIFYRFESDQSKMIHDVIKNELNIGVLSGPDYDALSDKEKQSLKVIANTVAYPEVLDVIYTDLALDVKLKLKQLLIGNKSKNKKTKVNADESNVRRFEKFIANGKDGYVYLRGIIKHEVVPMALHEAKK